MSTILKDIHIGEDVLRIKVGDIVSCGGNILGKVTDIYERENDYNRIWVRVDGIENLYPIDMIRFPNPRNDLKLRKYNILLGILEHEVEIKISKKILKDLKEIKGV